MVICGQSSWPQDGHRNLTFCTYDLGHYELNSQILDIFNLLHVWFLDSDLSELHINLDLGYIDLIRYPDTILQLYAKWAQVHMNLFLKGQNE